MKKIISLFQRNYDTDRLVRDEVVPGAEWVLNGEGIATRKYDGTCCLWKDKKLYKRYDVKKGRKVPDGFIPAQDKDEKTGHWPGWVFVGDGPEDRWHREALKMWIEGMSYNVCCPDGTYELIGPKINGNPEGKIRHILLKHGIDEIICPRTHDELKKWFVGRDIEGVVWYHADGRMAKIKGKDFGIKRKD